MVAAGRRLRSGLCDVLVGVLVLFGGAHAVWADAASGDTEPMSVLVVGTWQRASDPSLLSELDGQLVVSARQPLGPGHWEVELKAGNTPRVDGVSSRYPETNGILQENPDHNGKRQLGVTQLFYAVQQGRGDLAAGLLSSNEYLDTNPIANDEYRQFLGEPFINNPTIQAPSYAMAAAYKWSLSPTVSLTGYVSSTADLQESTYQQLFDFTGKGHGVFTAAELEWQTDRFAGNVGLWANTDASFITPLLGEAGEGGTEHAVDEPEPTERSRTAYGLYGNVSGHFTSALAWSLRAGWANPDVVVAATAVSIALEYRPGWRLSGGGPVTVGAGLARTGVSSHLVGPHANQWQAEIYARIPLPRHLSMSADLQWLRHSEFDPAKPSVWVAGLRLTAGF